ncbi:MAG: RidA family protein [Planctomycetes bacterium]|nr:RidA family protein [Planctomycetota bacterium]
MQQVPSTKNSLAARRGAVSPAARDERRALGLPEEERAASGSLDRGSSAVHAGDPRAIRAADVLNEAPDYPQATAFSRGLAVDLTAGARLLLLSGTASVGARGETLHAGDFAAQCWRTYRNLTRLLESEGANWHDVVRTTCYLRDIERDYEEFNAIRTEFFRALGLDPFPASTGIQVRLCRSDLLIEIEATALVRGTRGP